MRSCTLEALLCRQIMLQERKLVSHQRRDVGLGARIRKADLDRISRRLHWGVFVSADSLKRLEKAAVRMLVDDDAFYLQMWTLLHHNLDGPLLCETSKHCSTTLGPIDIASIALCKTACNLRHQRLVLSYQFDGVFARRGCFYAVPENMTSITSAHSLPWETISR